MALHGIIDAQFGKVVRKDLAVLWISPSTKRVEQYVKVGRNPFSFPLEIVFNLQGGEMTGHLETDLVTSTSILEEVETCSGIGFSSDLVAVPRGAPEVSGHDMGEELKISNDEGLEVGGRGTSDKFIVGKVEDSNTWQAVIPTIGTGVLCDMCSGGELQERDSVAELDGFNPPVDVFKECGVQNDVQARSGSAAFRGKDSIEEQSSGCDDSGGVHETAGE